MISKIKYKLLLTAVVSSVIFGAIYTAPLRDYKTVFSITDNYNDDNGGGDIVYPENLKECNGVLDITRFEVVRDKNNYLFKYKLNDFKLSSNFKNGFEHLNLDTYISIDNVGLQTTATYGAAIGMSQEFPWKYHIKITPQESYIEKLIDIPNRQTERTDIPVSINNKKLEVSFPKDYFEGFDLTHAKYYVFTGGFDIFGPDGYRKVVDEPNEWNFYGGIKSMYQPNVIDVVSPIQTEMLTYFMPPNYSVLTPVFNQKYQLYITKEILYIILVCISGLKCRTILKKGS